MVMCSSHFLSPMHLIWRSFVVFHSPFIDHVNQEPPLKPLCLHAPAEKKAEMWRDRLTLVRQRLMRNKLFAKSVVGKTGQANLTLVTLDSVMMGTSAPTCVLGLISELEEGRLFLVRLW